MKDRRGRYWTKEEEQFLRENRHLTNADLGRVLGRTINAINAKKTTLRLVTPYVRAGDKAAIEHRRKKREFPKHLKEEFYDFVCEVIEGSPSLRKVLARRLKSAL